MERPVFTRAFSMSITSEMIYPVLKNFTLSPGVIFDYRFQYLQGSVGSALPNDLTGWSGVLTIASWDDLTTYLTVRSGASQGSTGIFFGGDSNDPTSGIIDIFIDAADTRAVTWKYAKYGLALSEPNHDPFALLYGSFNRAGFSP